MDLKRIFIDNLKKFRNYRGISQLKLAELCNTSTNYIGEIEIGRRFPSFKLIAKISEALNIEPYRFFIAGIGNESGELDDLVNELFMLSDADKLTIINRISKPVT